MARLKISMWIPENKEPSWLRKFIQNEISQTQNVKSKETRKSALQSLNAVLQHARVGTCIYVENTFKLEPYIGTQFKYHCGREFVRPEPQSDYT